MMDETVRMNFFSLKSEWKLLPQKHTLNKKCNYVFQHRKTCIIYYLIYQKTDQMSYSPLLIKTTKSTASSKSEHSGDLKNTLGWFIDSGNQFTIRANLGSNISVYNNIWCMDKPRSYVCQSYFLRPQCCKFRFFE